MSAHDEMKCQCEACQGVRLELFRPKPPVVDLQGPCNYDPESRYYDQGGIEVQDIIRAKLTPEQYEGFCLGNIIKYSCRANWKGQKKRDIEKVGFYQMFLDEEMRERKS